VSAESSLNLRCPECGAEIVVDRTTGEILYHKRSRPDSAAGRSLEELMREEKAGRARAEDVFEREKASLADRERLLAEKFREALDRVEDDDEKPIRPFDLD